MMLMRHPLIRTAIDVIRSVRSRSESLEDAQRRAHSAGHRKAQHRRGVATIWLLLLLPLFIILLCLVVEIGNLWLARAELEDALEAAALAAVKEWAEAGGGSTLVSRNIGVAYAGANTVRGNSVVIQTNYDVLDLPNENANCAGDLVFGYLTSESPVVFDTSASGGVLGQAGFVLLDYTDNGDLNDPEKRANAWGVAFLTGPAVPSTWRITQIVLDYQAGSSTDGEFEVEGPSLGDTVEVRDEFKNVSYSNNEGSESWSSDWVESDTGGGGAAGGYIFINSGIDELQFNANPIPSNVGDSIYREADLSLAKAATLEFDYTNSPSGSDRFDIQVSGNGGLTWTSLDSFTDTLNTGSGSKSYDISSYIASNTRIRFLLVTQSGSSTLQIDDLEIYYPDPDKDKNARVSDNSSNLVSDLSGHEQLDTFGLDATPLNNPQIQFTPTAPPDVTLTSRTLTIDFSAIPGGDDGFAPGDHFRFGVATTGDTGHNADGPGEKGVTATIYIDDGGVPLPPVTLTFADTSEDPDDCFDPALYGTPPVPVPPLPLLYNGDLIVNPSGIPNLPCPPSGNGGPHNHQSYAYSVPGGYMVRAQKTLPIAPICTSLFGFGMGPTTVTARTTAVWDGDNNQSKLIRVDQFICP